MFHPRLHLLSIAGTDRGLPDALGVDGPAGVIDLVQSVVGSGLAVTATPQLMTAAIDPGRGGRDDDDDRVAELQRCLGDDGVAALIALRGGSWLTRILDRVDFDVLDRRRRTLHVFGFSELTTLVNIVAAHPTVRAWYDLGPAYLLSSLRGGTGRSEITEAELRARFLAEFCAFFEDAARMVEGRGSRRVLGGRRLAGELPATGEIHIVGGCLSVLVTLCGSRFEGCIDTAGRWLALEDIREHPHRLDRYLAQLGLCGLLRNCAGVLLGDFHHDGDDQTDTVMALLDRHLPSGAVLPIVGHCNFGHRHGVAPLALGGPVGLRTSADGAVTFEPRA